MWILSLQVNNCSMFHTPSSDSYLPALCSFHHISKCLASGIPEACVLRALSSENVSQTFKQWCHRPTDNCSALLISLPHAQTVTASRHGSATVSQVNSFQLQGWISPSWISHGLGRQRKVTKRGDVPPWSGHGLPGKHCQS